MLEKTPTVLDKKRGSFGSKVIEFLVKTVGVFSRKS
mgnify:CR=1 FL=1